ncbi:MAG: glycogen debranching protein [Candidatus Rokuibacteriota bacterium]|nr:MAG: glycogen debranching protein [Candidatus Rokubacteria bacterium]
MPAPFDDSAEWLEADGLGGCASGTAGLVRTRRYHALLLAAATPPTGRTALVNGVEAWIEGGSEPQALSAHRYAPGVTHPDGARRLVGFEPEPWPRWTWRLEDGAEIEHELFVPAGIPCVVLSWRLRRRPPARRGGMRLRVRPLLSGRDTHALHHENGAFRFEAELESGRVTWRPYPRIPAVTAITNGAYRHAPDWYRRFLYEEERARGLDHIEDLAAPGEFEFDLARGEAVLILRAHTPGAALKAADTAPERLLRDLRASERRRRARFRSRLERSADAYVVRRGARQTIVAGYPWFTDWGRDTFIALRGLCLATGRLDDARRILVQWAGTVSEGMLPNRFVEQGEAPEFNSVDASLWYVIAVHEFLGLAARHRRDSVRVRAVLEDAVEAILSGYAAGTRYRIHADDDGLLAAGEPGVQLTWMDAKIGDWVVTPRIGKPVEIQALWLNALDLAGRRSQRWAALHDRALRSFQARFWNEDGGYLYDVVDVDHVSGACDAAFRPNQIFAVGGLPRPIVNGGRAGRIVEAVERRLLTPLGLRSLAPGAPGYAPRYHGGVRERDGAYHQGTVWPWLLGPFVEAWLRVHHDTPEARREARVRFLNPLLRHVEEAGLGHVSEVADAEAPHTPGGCPFQAWSLGELVRLSRGPLADPEQAPRRAAPMPDAPRRAAPALEGLGS